MKKLLENKWARFFISASMIVTALFEIKLEFHNIGVSHGILLFATGEFLKTISEIFEAASIALNVDD